MTNPAQAIDPVLQSSADAERVIDATAHSAGTFLERAQVWTADVLLSRGFAIEVCCIIVIAVLAFAAGRWIGTILKGLLQRPQIPSVIAERLLGLVPLVTPALALVGIVVLQQVLLTTGIQVVMTGVIVNLLSAWLIIHFVTCIVSGSLITRMLSITVWFIAALEIVGLLDPVVQVLDDAAFQMGGVRISLLMVLWGVVLFTMLIWVSSVLTDLLDSQLARLRGVSPAARVLIAKVAHVGFFTMATVIALDSIGINFAALAVFTGAVGVGIGFGLQKVMSNLVSGIILLLDRSIKPGDVIEIGGTYGWITRLGARHVVVATRDGKECLIPNEDLITQNVVNWSYSSKSVRLHIPVGIGYECDLRLAMQLMVQAATQVPRVLKTPPPQAEVLGFGDSTVNLDLRIWINDPINGLINVKSDVMLLIWDLFHANGISLPFPQRDVHILSEKTPRHPGLEPG